MQFSNSPLRLVQMQELTKVGDIVNDEGKFEEEIRHDFINHFEIWDLVEIKFDPATESQVLKSFEQHNLELEAGI